MKHLKNVCYALPVLPLFISSLATAGLSQPLEDDFLYNAFSDQVSGVGILSQEQMDSTQGNVFPLVALPAWAVGALKASAIGAVSGGIINTATTASVTAKDNEEFTTGDALTAFGTGAAIGAISGGYGVPNIQVQILTLGLQMSAGVSKAVGEPAVEVEELDYSSQDSGGGGSSVPTSVYSGPVVSPQVMNSIGSLNITSSLPDYNITITGLGNLSDVVSYQTSGRRTAPY
ncbi:hypothetical protein HBA55_03470 [Pseudomaricurvus alkylphenolicus]|uniref:hypothetical protein n=1 Tax=Pseudomaricurvus alkylphenolicus TaxID=1306991 RepID=UPI0014248C58|nr:hypothetical protein [Pseudomaricurvus alkylphenolicus]NIB38628.1 hypothetical protein [Pseudomaricurvus alkylphenolicus]